MVASASMTEGGQSVPPPGVPSFAACEKLLRMLALVSFVGGHTRATTPTPAPFTVISVHPTPGATVAVNLPPSTWPPSSTEQPTPVVDPQPPQYCDFCGYARIENGPDKLIPPYSSNITCGDLYDLYGNATYPYCDVQLPADLPPLFVFDLRAYCSCTNTIPPLHCRMCGEGSTVPESNYLTAVQVPGIGNFTCEEAAELTDYIDYEEYCQQWTHALAGPCCGEGTAASTSDGVVVRKGGVMGATALGMAIAATLFS